MKPAMKWILGGLIGLLILAVAGAIAPRPDQWTQREYRQLQMGMTRVEVERVLNGPPRSRLQRRGTAWVPQPDGQRVSAFLDGGLVYPHFFPRLKYDQHQAVWVAPTGLIAVAYGRDGRLGDKYFSTVDLPAGPSLLGWLASRPRQLRRSLGL